MKRTSPVFGCKIKGNMISLLTVFLLVSVLVSGTGAPVSAESDTKSLSPKKVVSLIYDDSSSMHLNSNPSWAYANYALQTFTGLLNPNDTLMITFMSDKDRVVRSNSNGILKDFSDDRQSTIDRIRSTTKGGNITPFDAIDTAGKALLKVDDEDTSTQYWLVVITDGAFEKVPGDATTEVSKGELDERISQYAGATAANGTPVNCMYMAIGDGDKVTTPTEGDYLEVQRSRKSDIVDTMSSIADKISGRYRLEPEAIKVKDNSIRISSDIPLLNVQVLTQNSDAKVKSASIEEGGDLKVSSISVSSPKNVSGRNPGDKLFGNLGTITSGNDYIDEGEYVIEMTKAIDKEQLVVLYEPALETRMRIFRDGKEIKDYSVLRENEKIDIICDVVRLGTNKAVDLSALPPGLFQSMILTIDENGEQVVEKSLPANSNKLGQKKYKLKKGETVIEAITVLKGFAPMSKRIVLDPKKPIEYGIHPGENDLSLNKGQLKGKNDELEFIVTGDGAPLGQADVEALISDDSISITKDGKTTPVIFNYQVKKNGHLVITPKASFFNRALAIIRIPTGAYDVKVTVSKTASAEDQFRITMYTIFQLLWNLALLIFILLLLYLIRKPHFPNAKIRVNTYTLARERNRIIVNATRPESSIELSWFTDFIRLVGLRRCTRRGLKLVAVKNSRVHLDDRWVSANGALYRVIPGALTEESVVDAFTLIAGDEAGDGMRTIQKGQVMYLKSGEFSVITYELV